MVEQVALPRVTMEVTCSKGTYIRTLCHDIGAALGCGGCMESLLRTQVGPFYLEESVRLSEIEQLRDAGRLSEVIRPVDSVFQSYGALYLTKAGDRLVQNGNPVEAIPELVADAAKEIDVADGTRYRIYSSAGAFWAVYEWRQEKGRYWPVKMFLTESSKSPASIA